MDENQKEDWDQHAKDMSEMRERRRNQFHAAKRDLRRLGFDVREITAFQFRVNETLDIYPSNRRYHDIRKNQRGDIRGISFGDFIKKHFGLI